MENDPKETPVRETTNEARQGPLGRPIFLVLIGGLLLAILAWGAAEFYGESTDNSATVPQGNQTPAVNPPTTSDQPASNTPVQRNQIPQTGTGGDTQANPPKP